MDELESESIKLKNYSNKIQIQKLEDNNYDQHHDHKTSKVTDQEISERINVCNEQSINKLMKASIRRMIL